MYMNMYVYVKLNRRWTGLGLSYFVHVSWGRRSFARCTAITAYESRPNNAAGSRQSVSVSRPHGI